LSSAAGNIIINGMTEGTGFESERHYHVVKIHASDFRPMINAYELGQIPEYKFIIIGNRLVIGDINDHTMLALLDKYGPSPSLVEVLKNKEAAFKAIRDELSGQVVAAGRVAADGKVIEWTSVGFQAETPPELKNDIQATIAKTISSENGWTSRERR
jgi:hypothetical protein